MKVFLTGNIAVDDQHARTLDDVRRLAGKSTGVRGLAVVWHLLENDNATQIGEVSEKQYAVFIDRCKWLMSNTDYEGHTQLICESERLAGTDRGYWRARGLPAEFDQNVNPIN